MFLDASAIVAIVARETDAEDLVARLPEVGILYSPISRWQAILGFRRSYKLEHDVAVGAVDLFLEQMFAKPVSIGPQEGRMASDASRDYGRGRHPASLNMGDCFAYACAKSCGTTLLYKGGDFALTDLA